MEIIWLGHSCFRIKGKEATIVTDPFEKYPLKKLAPTIVTVSHEHPSHNVTEDFKDGCRTVRRPGEYEISNVFITGIPTFHDAEKGALRGKNNVYVMKIEDVVICHLGDLGHIPSADQIGEIGEINILMVPVGGNCTLNAAAAVETISLLQPGIAIPMHYRTENFDEDLEPVDAFLKEMGIKEAVFQPKLNVTKSSVPEETTVVLLDYRQ